MVESKKNGFTLSEILIALLIIGVIVALTLPALLKDVFAKSRMDTLTSTVENLQKAVDKELTESRAQTVNDTDIRNNPQNFLDTHFSLAANHQEALAEEYTTISNPNTVSHPKVSNSPMVLLKNGVGITFHDATEDSTGVYIDVNGADRPNTAGVDFFDVVIYHKNNNDTGRHAGEVGSENPPDNDAAVRPRCLGGDSAACYRLAELSGFNPRYLEANNN